MSTHVVKPKNNVHLVAATSNTIIKSTVNAVHIAGIRSNTVIAGTGKKPTPSDAVASYWAWGSSELIAFGSGTEIEL